jgi:hypothetical protein
VPFDARNEGSQDAADDAAGQILLATSQGAIGLTKGRRVLNALDDVAGDIWGGPTTASGVSTFFSDGRSRSQGRLDIARRIIGCRLTSRRNASGKCVPMTSHAVAPENNARHVIGCRLTQETRVHYVLDDVAGNIRFPPCQHLRRVILLQHLTPFKHPVLTLLF